MTTPHQPAPDGAYVVGGSGFGQNLTNDAIKALFMVPSLGSAPTLEAATDVFTQYLTQLPPEAVNVYRDFIPGLGEEDAQTDFESAVAAIMASLDLKPLFLGEVTWDEWLTNVFDITSTSLQQMFDIVAGDIVTAINASVQDFKDKWATLIATQAQASDTASAVAETWDRTFNVLMGLIGSGRTIDNLEEALHATADANAAAAARLSQIEAALGPGNPDSDAFERTGAIGSEWDSYTTGTGTVACDGHNLVITPTAASAYEAVLRRNVKQAQGDDHGVEIVLDSAPGSFVANGHDDLWIRMTTFSTYATRTGVRFRYSGSGLWTLDYFISGTPTNLASETLIPVSPKAGVAARLRFRAIGRRFIATLNDVPIVDETEVGTGSPKGVSNRYRGAGGKGDLVLFNPGRMRQWTATG